MKRIISTVLIIPTLTFASGGAGFKDFDEYYTIQRQAGWVKEFDDFDKYYATQQDRLFSGKGIEMNMYQNARGDDAYFALEDTSEKYGRKVKIKVDADHDTLSFMIDGHIFEPRQIKMFPGEGSISYSDLSMDTAVYFKSDWTCLEDTPKTARSTGIGDKSVFLVKTSKGHKPQAWKLPNLYASCSGIRMKNGQVMFDKIEYRFQKGKDISSWLTNSPSCQGAPIGVSFKEYIIQGGKFKRTKKPPQNATFVDPCDVFKFTLDKP
ncbi:MAG: hypothetical protein FWG52_08310 [Proteobacteria bacterium]|nr:hypothetical protein [Pseudomonadota bacterium]